MHLMCRVLDGEDLGPSSLEVFVSFDNVICSFTSVPVSIAVDKSDRKVYSVVAKSILCLPAMEIIANR